jgi:hypothetical protein
MSKFDDQVYDNISATVADGNEENHDLEDMEDMDECFEIIDKNYPLSFIKMCREAQECIIDNNRFDCLFKENHFGEVMDEDRFAMECELINVILDSPPIGGYYHGDKGKIHIPKIRESFHTNLYSPNTQLDEGNRLVVYAEIITHGDMYNTARCDYGMIYINKKKFAKYIPNVGNIVRMIVIVKEIEVAFRLACMVIL